MVTPAVHASFDVAFWFTERARRDNSYLQPQKLQCLLYLSQGIYAASYHGRMLMPAIFLVDDNGGPVEPNIYGLFARGRPNGVQPKPVTPEVEMFLNDIWRSYGFYPADKLSERISRHKIIMDTRKIGSMEEIPFFEIRNYFEGLKAEQNAKRGKSAYKSDTIETIDGRRLSRWRPREIGKKGMPDTQ